MHTKNQILAMALVERLIEAGSPISAVSDDKFTVSDASVPAMEARFASIMREFEPIDPLRSYIVDYLRELGRDASEHVSQAPLSWSPSFH